MDLSKMFEKAREMQEKMKLAQEQLVKISASGESGAGMVSALINGNRQITKLTIDPDILKPEDKEMVEDLVVAAINKALENIEVKIKEEMRQNTSDILPNIPGVDFSNFM